MIDNYREDVVTMTNPDRRVLVIGAHFWGIGKDVPTAKANFRKEGGVLSKGYTIVEFDPGQEFLGVSPINGEVSWRNDDESDREPKATSVPPRGKNAVWATRKGEEEDYQ